MLRHSIAVSALSSHVMSHWNFFLFITGIGIQHSIGYFFILRMFWLGIFIFFFWIWYGLFSFLSTLKACILNNATWYWTSWCQLCFPLCVKKYLEVVQWLWWLRSNLSLKIVKGCFILFWFTPQGKWPGPPVTKSQIITVKEKCINLRSLLRREAEYWLEESWWRWGQTALDTVCLCDLLGAS